MRIVRTTARRAPLRLNGSSVSEACPWTTGRTGSASQQSSAGVDWFNSPLGRAHTLVRIGGAYWLRVRELLKHSVVGPARLHPQIDSSNPAAISATMKTICSSVPKQQRGCRFAGDRKALASRARVRREQGDQQHRQTDRGAARGCPTTRWWHSGDGATPIMSAAVVTTGGCHSLVAIGTWGGSVGLTRRKRPTIVKRTVRIGATPQLGQHQHADHVKQSGKRQSIPARSWLGQRRRGDAPINIP